MKNKHIHNKGFSLLEVVLCIILMGIIGAIWGLGIIQVVDGFILSKENTETVQKAQMTMTRLIKEFKAAEYIKNFPSPDTAVSSITFSRNPDDLTDTYTISFDGTAGIVEIKKDKTGETDILADNVNAFTLEYYSDYSDGSLMPASDLSTVKMINIILKLNSSSSSVSEFKTRVFLRGLAD